jgi:hypothetical protein
LIWNNRCYGLEPSAREVERLVQPVGQDDNRHQEKSATNNGRPKETGDRGHEFSFASPFGEPSAIAHCRTAIARAG